MPVFPPVRSLLGVPYVIASVTQPAGAPFDAARYPLTNLIDGTSKTAYRSSDPIVALRFDLGANLPVSFVGVIGHNFDRGAMCSVHATSSVSTFTIPGYITPDDESTTWVEAQVLSRAFRIRYPNCWVDTRSAAGVPTSARYWQLHTYQNTRPVTISEVVIGLADEYDGVVPLPLNERLEAKQARAETEYGKLVSSASGVVVRTMDMNLSIAPSEQTALRAFFELAQSAAQARVVVVPSTRFNDLWYVEWPHLRALVYPDAPLVATHQLSLVEEVFGAV